MTTIIDDSNFRQLVKLYYEYNYDTVVSLYVQYDIDCNQERHPNSEIPNPLPADLQGIPLQDWNINEVTDMSFAFEGFKFFNEPLANWATKLSKVTTMEKMFYNCHCFNQDLNSWDVSNVTNMRGMFRYCFYFNQPLNNWNVSNVIRMDSMFRYCFYFNQPLNNWNVSNVIGMDLMFNGCINFNQPINNWDVRKVQYFDGMYEDCPISEENKASLNNYNKWYKRVNEKTMLLHAVGDDETIIRNDALGKMPYDVKRYIGQHLGGKKSRRRRKKSKRKTRRTRRTR